MIWYKYRKKTLLVMRHILKVVNSLGVKDTVTTKYMRQNEIFADAFNYFVYGGEQVINPESLEELDTCEVEIENQSNIHYAMPVKNMVYDALQYAKQVEAAVASHKVSGDYKGADSDEYLSGFMKEDRLLPVVTLVIYFDSKEWSGPLSIHDMFDKRDARVLALVPDYKINLLAPVSIEDGDFGKFQSSLKEVLSFIKYARDKDELKKVLDADESFRHLGRKEVDVLNACVGAKIAVKEGEEAVDVCLAIQQMNEEAAQKAAQKERISTLFANIKNLMEKMGWSAEQSMDVLSVSDSDRKAIRQLLKSKT